MLCPVGVSSCDTSSNVLVAAPGRTKDAASDLPVEQDHDGWEP